MFTFENYFLKMLMPKKFGPAINSDAGGLWYDTGGKALSEASGTLWKPLDV